MVLLIVSLLGGCTMPCCAATAHVTTALPALLPPRCPPHCHCTACPAAAVLLIVLRCAAAAHVTVLLVMSPLGSCTMPHCAAAACVAVVLPTSLPPHCPCHDLTYRRLGYLFFLSLCSSFLTMLRLCLALPRTSRM